MGIKKPGYTRGSKVMFGHNFAKEIFNYSIRLSFLLKLGGKFRPGCGRLPFQNPPRRQFCPYQGI
jgi:hypothetical protein